MKVLGIETSCDETAASVVEDGRFILSNIIVTSLKEHAKYGGVIPEIASRRQLEFINTVVEKSLSKAQLSLRDIDAFAVTYQPGLIGSLLVGISFARALSFATQKPLIEVDHIKAHLYANFLNFNKDKKAQPQLPAVGLVVSGGHTSLYYLKDFSHFKLLGQTLDDAAGEAFDKVARILNLGYPGGPVIDRLAKTITRTPIRFNPSELPGRYDFSFSGTKTAVLYHARRYEKESNFSAAEVAYAFQKSVVSILVKKCIWACQKLKTKTLLVGGGVAANSQLRNLLIHESEKNDIQAHFPELSLCMDNAAMIAGLGFQLLKKGAAHAIR